MLMVKGVYHANAYLVDFRNIRPGLRSRTIILNALEKRSSDAKTIARLTGLHYRVVLHHLKLLGSREIVRQEGGKPSVWMLTGLGQKRLR